MSELRLLLDTNVWTGIVKADAVDVLKQAARTARVSVIACPAVAYEVLATSDQALRTSLINAITRSCWLRIMPEAFVEAEEVRAEIQRRHPDWLSSGADLGHWYKLQADWKSAWWLRARRDPETEARLIGQLGGQDLAQARFATRADRQELAAAKIRFETLDLSAQCARYSQPTPGWDGSDFEPWRGEARERWWRALFGRDDGALRDWLAPWLDLTVVSRSFGPWTQFWLDEAERDLLPLQWLRWAFGVVQATRKPTDGTPIDNQIATYLTRCDLFLTADKAFAECIEKVRPLSPVPLASVTLVPGGPACPDRVLEIIRESGAG